MSSLHLLKLPGAIITLPRCFDALAGIVELFCGHQKDDAREALYRIVNLTLLCSNALQVFSN